MLKKRKIIIGVHGLGNKPPKSVLEKWWREATLEGLESSRRQANLIQFELLYWADILHLQPLDPNIRDKSDEFYIDHPYLPADGTAGKAPGKIRIKFRDYLEKLMEEVFLKDDLTINFSKITDKLIHRYFRDLEAYYKARYKGSGDQELSARDRIRNRLAELLKKHRKKEILLIAHSMGSMVAYDVLTQVTPEIKIDTLVTMGSPLGLPIVISRIAAEQSGTRDISDKLNVPENIINNWFNLSDLDDRIAINYNLRDDYKASSNNILPEDFIVYNNYRYKDEKNPHSSYGYLRTPEMVKIISDFMDRKQPSYLACAIRKVKNIILALYNKFNQRNRIEP